MSSVIMEEVLSAIDVPFSVVIEKLIKTSIIRFMVS